ncbi:MAG: ABC transporter ATP-binding protein [bacterium]|nr:ABC transporter ATP-binding protein [bacterium]
MLSLRGIHRVYRTGRVEVHALRGIDLEIGAGEFVTIMGPSGSGKSTLLNVIGCLDRPSRGGYSLAGREVDGLGDRDLACLRNETLGFVFQTFNLLPRLTAGENVELPLVYRGIGGSERRGRARAALERVGLGARGHHRPTELSGGEQQRVAIARALVGEPRVVLADEPTGNLDSGTSEEIMGIFRRLNEEEGLTLVQVSHDPVMARHGKRIVYLRDGVVTGDEQIAAALRSPLATAG